MILERVEQTIQKFNMLESNDRVVIAVSGGPDSVALLYLLNKLKNKWRLYLHIAHLNHMLRKDEADSESLFVSNLAKKLKLPLSLEHIEVKDFAKKMKLSIEEAARKLRYDFFLKVAKENFISKIALGHNNNDQAETVLMRFLRGSGISGLRGIPAKRKLDSCLIIRPLIEIRREQILRFLSLRNIPYRSDSSNLNNLYFRNRIRNELIPYLEKSYNPNIKEILANFAENISDDFDFLERSGQNRFKAVRANSAEGEITISSKKFSALHKALQKLVARLAVKELKGDLRRIDYRHWKELEDLLGKRPKNSIVDLPGGVSVVKKSENLVFYRRKLK